MQVTSSAMLVFGLVASTSAAVTRDQLVPRDYPGAYVVAHESRDCSGPAVFLWKEGDTDSTHCRDVPAKPAIFSYWLDPGANKQLILVYNDKQCAVKGQSVTSAKGSPYCYHDNKAYAASIAINVDCNIWTGC
ncbi:hypothetical protein VHEMI09069 [[Torrubiella] hemipterigena]|uniref:Uncharacterized protein n=1 Tax=[Torrubiella] hemipterigena TaxID=1531966 RepID=A0A0A1T8N9_9HYPO|nr:hypothetical protein VHEMI09069 [[Torrubiella] hemipterigena]